LPAKRLTIVDLPTLGRPIIATMGNNIKKIRGERSERGKKWKREN
jgi:hypothetical protein